MRISDVSQYCTSFLTATDFLREKCILRRDIPRCKQCDGLMTEVKKHRGEELTWRCPAHKGQKISLRDGSFLQRQGISLKHFILIAYFWAHEIPMTTTAEMVGLSQPTTVQWYSYMRDVCSDHFANNPVTVGGPDHIVQINEFNSLMSEKWKKKKMKNENGNVGPTERWVFVGVDLTTNIGFLSFVPNRSPDTLIPIIQQFILPGTTIHSNSLSTDMNITKIPVVPRYVHEIVDHTDLVECMWQKCQKKFETMSGVHSTKLQSYLEEFMWRQQYGQTHTDSFNNILLHISQLYVTP